MTTYASPANLLAWFGAKDLSETSSVDDLTPVTPTLLRLTITASSRSAYSAGEIAAADAALVRIQQALDDAGRLLESYLARRFALPLDNTTLQASHLPRVCGDIARHLLHDDLVPPEIASRHAEALSWLRDLAAGKAELGGSTPPPGERAGLPDYVAGTRLFTDTALRGF